MNDMQDILKLLNALSSKSSKKSMMGIDLPDEEFIKHTLFDYLPAKSYLVTVHNAAALSDALLKCVGRLAGVIEAKTDKCPIKIFKAECNEAIEALESLKESMEDIKKLNIEEKTALLEKLNKAD